MLAWTLPIVPAVIYVNQALYGRLLDPGRDRFPDPSRAVRYALADLPGVLLTMISLRLVPIIVVESIDSVESAHVVLPWSIITVCAVALPALSRVVLSEMSHHEGTDEQATVLPRLERRVLTLLLPAAVLAAACSPLVLRVAGEGYARDGGLVLAIGVLGLVPASLVELRLAALRFAGRMVQATVLQSVRAVAVLGGSIVAAASGHVEWIGAVFAVGNLLTLAAADTATIADRRDTVARLVPGLGGLALATWAMRDVDVTEVDDSGLFAALPLGWFLGVGLLAVGAAVCAERARGWRILCGAQIVALVVLLHGLPGMVDDQPRFPVAWLHVGFADEIATDGRLLPLLDGRFSWAGFFAGGGWLQRMSGEPSLHFLLRYFPVVVNLLAVLAILVLARLTGTSRRQGLVAALLFVVANWIGQDYFAPQAVAFLLYLAVVVVVLAAFGDDPRRRLGPRLQRWLRPEPVDVPAVDRRTEVLAYVAAVAMSTAMVAAHQLTPAVLAVALGLFALTGRSRVSALPFIVFVLYLGWMSFSAEAYWMGHLDSIFGSIGDITSLLDANVGARNVAPSTARQMVLRSRMGLALLVWVAAVVSLLRLRAKGRMPVALACLFAAPFLMVPLQPYGGEMLLRVTFFTLPASSLLIARLLLPETSTSRGRAVAIGVVAALMIPFFVLARFGNERFERITNDDAALVADAQRLVPDGAVVFVRNRQTVLYGDRVGEVAYRDFGGLPVDELVAQFDGARRPAYVMLTEGQAAFFEVTRGLDQGWTDQLVGDLLATGRFRIAARHGEAVLLELLPRPPGQGKGNA